ncbi:mitotic-spindle organizing protein 2A [Trichonephila clavipes]|nr:mitotic-spindle organizing protein 2A [Trichonephila clavipes]
MNLLEWCMRENLISSRYECPKCGKDMVLRERKGTIDGYEWRCRTKGGENPHDVCKSIRKGTWFSKSHLSVCDILILTLHFFGKSMNEFAVKDVRVNKNTVVDWYMFCREVCMVAVLKESEPLGGEGKIVEIDESMFGKMKYGKGKPVLCYILFQIFGKSDMSSTSSFSYSFLISLRFSFIYVRYNFVF